MAVVTELITKFGFEGSLDPLKNYNDSLGQGIKLLAGQVPRSAVSSSASMRLLQVRASLYSLL